MAGQHTLDQDGCCTLILSVSVFKAQGDGVFQNKATAADRSSRFPSWTSPEGEANFSQSMTVVLISDLR